MNLSDKELIQQLLSNDSVMRERAWSHVYHGSYPLVKEMILKSSGSEDDAFDIFQDGLLILNQNLRNRSYRNDSALSTYVVGICKNLWRKEYDRKHKQSIAEQELILETRQNINYLINVEIVSLLMIELGEDCRNILTEYYYNNRSMEELKEIFNVNSVQAAKNKKWRCMNYLIRLFKEKGVTPTWS